MPLDANIAGALPQWCLRLKDLRFVADGRAISWEQNHVTAMHAMLRQWGGMRSLVLTAIDSTLLDHIGCSFNQSLTELRIRILFVLLSTKQSLLHLTDFSLPCLHTFEFSGNALWCAEFLPCTAESPLQVVELKWHDEGDKLALTKIGTALASRKLPSFLRSIRLRDESSIGGDRGQFLDHIQPLLTFEALQTFELSSDLTFHVNNQAIQQVSKAWKYIKSFTLEVNVTPSLSLESLAYFTHCPNLTQLSLPVYDTRDLPEWAFGSDPPDHVYSNDTLTALGIGASYIRHPLDVAAFISRLFPSIEHIDVSPGDGEDEDEDEDEDEQLSLWSQCNEYLPTVSMIRQGGLWKKPEHEETR
ncbi:hypothetical protein DL96DRAFT_1714941 [Flagelloscypha sp. PMI_526]|nr:hypothetical protein DL96DRAFT_1714941 [Flagelloscypha sp. PMI_526]